MFSGYFLHCLQIPQANLHSLSYSPSLTLKVISNPSAQWDSATAKAPSTLVSLLKKILLNTKLDSISPINGMVNPSFWKAGLPTAKVAQ